MKKQTGFISSSSSVTITYSTSCDTAFNGYSDIRHIVNKTQVDVWDGKTFSKYSDLTNSTSTQKLLWKTYSSNSYQRIEYFLEAVEKLNSPYSKSTKSYFPLYNFAKYIDKRNIYNGFVDLVITFPCKIRLAGIELLNPWNNKLTKNAESSNWKFLPSKFSIFKVNDELKNAAMKSYSYETDIATFIKGANGDTEEFRPIRYDKIDSDDGLIYLGNYEVNWETINSYKCFFKFNENDPSSINVENSFSNAGTATWCCKQLVIRIYKTGMTGEAITDKNIYAKLSEYVAEKEINYGTTYNNNLPTPNDIMSVSAFFFGDYEYINKNGSYDKNGIIKNTLPSTWSLGSNARRNYNKVNNVSFAAGLEYKIGGIQLLLSPDIFSISEMKMYNYSNTTNNKVFIGEWNKDLQDLEYYGAGTIRTSDYIDISNVKSNAISWHHNFNVPPKYLDAQVYARFKVDFGSFYAGDVITNIVNIDKEPLSLRLTGTEVTLNISKGICFSNPETGEFIQFKDGFGIDMDRPGNYDALNAALDVNANIIEAQSLIAAKIEPIDMSKGGAYPFELYFVVKRLF